MSHLVPDVGDDGLLGFERVSLVEHPVTVTEVRAWFEALEYAGHGARPVFVEATGDSMPLVGVVVGELAVELRWTRR